MVKTQLGTAVATFFIGGAADKNRFWYLGPKTNLIGRELVMRYFAAISNRTFTAVEMNKGVQEAYFGYDELEQVLASIRRHHQANPAVKIRLVGHSLGAWQAAKISAMMAAEGITTSLLITIDPVGIVYFMRLTDTFWRVGSMDPTPPRPVAQQWINILAHYPGGADIDDKIADAGMRWHPARDPGVKSRPAFDYGAPFHHGEPWKMMAFPGAAGKSAWQILTDPNP
jgi:hypothetical protein